MLIWLLVLAIFVILGVTSYYKGAIRSLVSLVGLVFALFLTLPLSPLLRPLVPKVGLANPLWSVFLPPVVVFALFVLIFGGAAFFVHYKVNLYFKYKTDDYTRLRWERLNRRMGACVGLVAGAIYTIMVGLVLYIFGYLGVQVAGDDSPGWVKFVSNVRVELKDAGLDRTLAGIDPMPEYYYLATDVIGLIYHNHVLQDRLVNYPGFLALSERPEFQDIATDVDLQGLLQTRAPFLNILNHPKIQAVISNAEIVQELKQIDLKDLYQYLRTGKSAKYEDEKILGRWKLDTAATLTLAKKQNPDMSAQDMTKIKKLVTIFMPKVSFLATPDNKAIVKMELTDEAKKLIEAAKAAAQPAPDPNAPGAAPPGMDPTMAARYGLRPRSGARTPPPGAAAPPPAPAAAKAAAPIPELNLSSQGSWQRAGEKYKLKLQDEKGKEHAAEALAEEEKLLVSVEGQSMVFVR